MAAPLSRRGAQPLGDGQSKPSPWPHALTLDERITSLPLGEPPYTRAQQRLDRWRTLFPFLRDDHLDALAATQGITAETLIPFLGEPPDPQDRQTSAPWLADLIAALGAPPSDQLRDSPNPNDTVDLTAFLNLIAPLIEQAQNRLHDGVQTLIAQHPDAPLTTAAVTFIIGASLPGTLLPLVSRTLALELNVARLRGDLHGDTARARFQHFCERLCNSDTRLSLLHEYPVLARLVAERLRTWTAFQLEFLNHLCVDWPEIRRTFAPHQDPGTLAHIHAHQGDNHRQGRSVLVLEFNTGLRVVYKPKALSVDVHFQELLAWLNKRSALPPFPLLKILARDTYGWAEFVPFRSCTCAEEITRFYQRQGAYLAILHALEAVDFHYENLIASGGDPFLVDLETLFHPRVGYDLHAQDPAQEVLHSSVLRIGLLPHRRFSSGLENGIDLSGLGASPGQKFPFAVPRWTGVGTDELRLQEERTETTGGNNRPTLNAQAVDIVDYADAVLHGFTRMHRTLQEHKSTLLADDGPVARFAADETRVVLRPTVTYATLLSASYHPDVLRDALDRDMLLHSLWLDAKKAPHLMKALPAEIADLRNGDIPMFTTRTDTTDLWTSTGARIAGFFDEPALARVRRRLNDLNDADLARQQWLIKASLTALAMNGHRQQKPLLRIPAPAVAFDRVQWVAAARDIGQILQRTALHGDGNTVSWLGVSLTAKQRWSLAPVGIGLYDGLPGIALFLAYLAAECDEPAFEELARGTLHTLRQQLSAHPAHAYSMGAFDGLGGIIYLLTHLGSLWNDNSLLTEAANLADAVKTLAIRDRAFDVVSGSAGGIACLLALHRITPSDALLDTATTLGDHLLAHAQPCATGHGWITPIPAWAPLTGFSHGAAGIAWALLELSALTDEQRFRAGALKAIEYERACFSQSERNWPDLRQLDAASENPQTFGTAWCHGAPGITLARLRALRHIDTPEIRQDIDAGIATTLREGFGGNHSLCHGDLGNLEVLLQASEILDSHPWQNEITRIASRVVASGITNGWLSGIPLGVESPGLMTGLSGIGLGLLRAAHPDRIPPVLLLAPPA